MKTSLLAAFACSVLFILLADCGCSANPYFDDKEVQQIVEVERLDDDSDNAFDSLVHVPRHKRSCIQHGGNCDHRFNDCCSNLSCRCNLWGTSCRCQRSVFGK